MVILALFYLVLHFRGGTAIDLELEGLGVSIKLKSPKKPALKCPSAALCADQKDVTPVTLNKEVS